MVGEKTETSFLVHVILIACIVIFGYICAVAVQGVGFVWSIFGSSIALIIKFFVPLAYYLKIRSKNNWDLLMSGQYSSFQFLLLWSVHTTYLLTIIEILHILHAFIKIIYA